MVGPERRRKLFENIAHLRRAELETSNPDIAAVREDLERELGETVSRALAARILGVSHTTLNDWIRAGDAPVVVSREGRPAVPVAALLDLHEAVRRERETGRRKLHVLEPIMKQGRARSERMRPEVVLAGEPEPVDRHRLSELRSLAYHRYLAPRLRRRTVDEARRRIRRWSDEGKIDPRYADRWEAVLCQPIAEIRKIISADTEAARDLRQNSPFAGLLSEPERRKIIERVR